MREVKERNGEENLDSDKHHPTIIKHRVSNSSDNADFDYSRNRKA